MLRECNGCSSWCKMHGWTPFCSSLALMAASTWSLRWVGVDVCVSRACIDAVWLRGRHAAAAAANHCRCAGVRVAVPADGVGSAMMRPVASTRGQHPQVFGVFIPSSCCPCAPVLPPPSLDIAALAHTPPLCCLHLARARPAAAHAPTPSTLRATGPGRVAV